MAGAPFFSETQVDSVRVSECSLWTNQEPPTGQLATDTNIELSNPVVQRDVQTGTLSSGMFLALTVSYSDEDVARIPRARLNVKITGRVIAPAGVELSDHEVRVAAVSQMYPQAQSYLSILGAMAGLNGVSVPTASAEALATALESALPKNGDTDAMQQ